MPLHGQGKCKVGLPWVLGEASVLLASTLASSTPACHRVPMQALNYIVCIPAFMLSASLSSSSGWGQQQASSSTQLHGPAPGPVSQRTLILPKCAPGVWHAGNTEYGTLLRRQHCALA